ncbi:hypothetical protein CEUSTIGMA_g8355.t1 [Chlamydomonas eustigma]|uniref:Mechanosensitive ion channel MscS domain-containing protein n=1 Tax=Chlamydomonas eustigma TaxID=1157962 RepID=A0A250XDT1_9CHLO|nr:hypothetical protein CEUSTIGMA_g8355.t1 [Chlamydomonas eustigma]|eukprot:GAX80920.1 hypothetical protein CEUSTIGMA_g8355.t1 [Chlamydomonas eustigma]
MPELLQTLDAVLSVMCFMVGLAYCSDAMALPLSKFAASLGVFGLLLGLASQELVMNLVGGMVLLTTRPFTVGDSISSPLPYGVGSIKGTVVSIGLLSTMLLSTEATPVNVPKRTSSRCARLTYRTGHGSLRFVSTTQGHMVEEPLL